MAEDERPLDEDESEIIDWFASVLNSEPAPTPLAAAALDDEDDDDPADTTPVPMLSEAWKGGGTMSSSRWFKRSPAESEQS